MGTIPGLRKQETLYSVPAFEGQDNATKDISLTQKAEIAQNARFNQEIQSVVKRSPISYYNPYASPEPNPIQSIYRYYRKSNDTSYLLQLNGNTLRVGFDSTGAFSTLWTFGASSGYRFTAVTYNDLALISTGKDNIIQTDGTAAWELGSYKAALKVDATGSVDAGAHYYAVVFVVNGADVVNGAHSNTVTTNAANTKAELSNIPQGPLESCTARKIYRTAAGANTLKLLDTLSNNSTTTYTDNKADSALGAAMGAVTDDMPRGKFLYLAQDRLFVTGDWYSGTGLFSNTVYYSDQYLPHYIATYSPDITSSSAIAATDYYDIISSNDNDLIVGIALFLGATYIFKQNSIRPYHISGTPDTWLLGDIISTQGSPSGYSIVTTPYGIVYQGWDYFYVFNGNFATPLFGEFLVKENILAPRITQTVATYWKGLYLAVYTADALGHQYHDRVLVYDMVYKQVAIDKGGPRTTGSLNVNCFGVASGGSDEGQLYAGDSVAGYVYKYDTTSNVVKYAAKSDFDTGTYTTATWVGDEADGILSRMTLDSMEYSSDALAQAAWVSSETTASKKVPPDLGSGADGAKTVSADETLSTGIYNYISVIIDAGDTLTAIDSTIKCLGTVTVNGTLVCDTIYAHTVTVGAAGAITCDEIRCNTLNNSGSLKSETNACVGGTLDGSANEACRDGSFTVADAVNIPTTQSNYSVTGSILFDSKSISYIKFRFTAGITASNGRALMYLYLNVSGTWTLIWSHDHTGAVPGSYDSGTVTTSTGWNTVTGMRVVVQTASTGGAYASAANYEIQAWEFPDCDFINSAGTVPTSGSATDYVYALDVFSEDDSTLVTEASYALKIVVPPGADTLNETITKTITAIDLSAAIYDKILVDVYALRSGTQFQFGIGETAGTDNLVNIPVTASNTAETVELDFSGVADVDKDAIIKLAFKFTNTDSGNVVYIDNIRPALTSATWTSPILSISASSLGNMYWNETLGDYGNVTFQTRNSSTPTGVSAAAWSAATTGDYTGGLLTNPAGSAMKAFAADGTTVTTDATLMQYFQFRVNFTTTQTQTPDPDYSQFPYLYILSTYVVKFDYYKTLAPAETSVEFVYQTGYRNFDTPLSDKTFKKVISVHEGKEGTFEFSYGLDYISTWPSFAYDPINLAAYPRRWESFFPDSAFGREVNFRWYKNDIYDFKIKQVGIVITSEPII